MAEYKYYLTKISDPYTRYRRSYRIYERKRMVKGKQVVGEATYYREVSDFDLNNHGMIKE